MNQTVRDLHCRYACIRGACSPCSLNSTTHYSSTLRPLSHRLILMRVAGVLQPCILDILSVHSRVLLDAHDSVGFCDSPLVHFNCKWLIIVQYENRLVTVSLVRCDETEDDTGLCADPIHRHCLMSILLRSLSSNGATVNIV